MAWCVRGIIPCVPNFHLFNNIVLKQFRLDTHWSHTKSCMLHRWTNPIQALEALLHEYQDRRTIINITQISSKLPSYFRTLECSLSVLHKEHKSIPVRFLMPSPPEGQNLIHSSHSQRVVRFSAAETPIMRWIVDVIHPYRWAAFAVLDVVWWGSWCWEWSRWDWLGSDWLRSEWRRSERLRLDLLLLVWLLWDWLLWDWLL